MSATTIAIDEKYTYSNVDHHVQILRNGLPWLGEDHDLPGAKAWISAAEQLQELRDEVARLRDADAERKAAEKNSWIEHVMSLVEQRGQYLREAGAAEAIDPINDGAVAMLRRSADDRMAAIQVNIETSPMSDDDAQTFRSTLLALNVADHALGMSARLPNSRPTAVAHHRAEAKRLEGELRSILERR